MPSQDLIRIKNASFYAYHGVATDEQNLGGKFEVDLELRGDFSRARASDNLKDAVNYESVYTLIQAVVTERKYYLIEALADAIAKGLIAKFPMLQEVSVIVRKPHPPVKGVVDYIEIEVKQGRK